MIKLINFTDAKTILNGYPEDSIDLYEAVDHEYYGTYYWNKGLNTKQVKCIDKKWYDYDGIYIRDWNGQDEIQALDVLPY